MYFLLFMRFRNFVEMNNSIQMTEQFVKFFIFYALQTGHSITCITLDAHVDRMGSNAMAWWSNEYTFTGICLLLCNMVDGHGYCLAISNIYDLLGFGRKYFYLELILIFSVNAMIFCVVCIRLSSVTFDFSFNFIKP